MSEEQPHVVTSLVVKNEKAYKVLDDMHDKYFDLVSMARKYPDGNRDDCPIQAFINTVWERFPEESEKLCGKDSDWQHGFHSGCLAMLRMVYDLSEEAKEFEDGLFEQECGGTRSYEEMVDDAILEFPNLDT